MPLKARSGLFISATWVLLAAPTGAFAQGGQDQGSVSGRDEIVVTSRSRQGSIQDIGASLTGLTGEELQNQGLRDIDDIARIVQGLRS